MAGAGRGNSQTRPTGQCSYCGFALPPSARFCGGCGRPRAAPTALAVHALSFLQSQIQPALADRIIQSGTSMLGERKHVTVLFADIQQSTELIDKLDPEDALEVIGPILKRLMDAVHEHDGLVNQTRGDGIMALFGAPIASEDHAVQACRAALAAREAVLDFNRTHQRSIGLRIGLNSGQVIIHSIGNNLSMNYDAVGKTVHLAARMEELAAADSIKLSSDTFQLAKGFVSALPLGSEAAKGIGEPIETYELVAMRPRTRWQARLSGGLSPLIGRDEELTYLKNALAKASAGEGGAICITGPAGIGKSRLVHEFVSGIASEWLVVQTACAPQRTNSTYYPVSNLIRELFRISADEPPASAVGHVQTRLEHFDPTLAPHLPAVLSLLDLNSPDETWRDLEPLERRNKVIEAIKALILSQVRLTPLLILIEDIHWIDAETLLILNNVTAALGDTPIVIIATQRPENIWAVDSVGRLDLSALNSADGDQLLSSLLGDDGSLAPLRRQILAQAEGNPLFVEELARTLKDTKVLVGDSGQYRVSSASPGIEIPETIHSVLAARIDRLDPSGKSLLQMSAVIGPELSLTLLADMAGVEPDDLRLRLAPLEAADFIKNVGTPANPDYAFKHELTREVAYGMMLLSVRRYLHAKATEIIERRFGDRLDEHIDRLADHAFLAELWQKAFPYQLRSCRRAIKRGANRAAIAIYERGRETLSHWQPSQKKTIAEIDLHLTVVTALEPLGMHRRIADVLRETRHLAEQSQESWRVAAVNCQLTVALWRLGHHTEAMAAARTAEAIAEQIRQPVLTFAALHNLGIIYHEIGDFRSALDIHEKCLAIETPEIDERRAGWAALPSVMLRTFMTDSLIDLGDFPRAELLAEDARARAIAANHAYSLANINHVLSRLRIAQNRPHDALTVLNESWQTCLDLEMKQMYPIFASRIGEAYLLLNDVDNALRILAVPEELDIPLADHAFGWRFLFIAQGYAFLAAGRREEAASVAARALELAKERCELPQQAYANKLLGDVARGGAGSSHNGSSRDASESYYREAMDLAERCGMQPFALKCQDALAALVV